MGKKVLFMTWFWIFSLRSEQENYRMVENLSSNANRMKELIELVKVENHLNKHTHLKYLTNSKT